MKSPVSRLLQKSISKSRILSYAVCNIIGLTIITVAVIFYFDIKPAFEPEKRLSDTGYMVLSHRISPFGGGSWPFTEEDIEQIRSREWVADAAPLKNADFNINATARLGGGSFSTALFFESVPNRFIDNIPEDFTFSEGDSEIPVILPRDYLSLYNFGFAASRGLPALSDAMIGSMPMTVDLQGKKGGVTMRARIVGFTSRINSILVPEEFMDYANRLLSGTDGNKPERIIVKTDDPGNSGIAELLAEDNLEAAGIDSGSHRLSGFLQIITGIIILIGAIITVMSLIILVLSLNLLIQKNRREISGLLLLGYPVSRVAGAYSRPLFIINAACLVIAVAAAAATSLLWRGIISEFGFGSSGLLPGAAVVIAVSLLLTLRGNLAIRKSVKKEF